MPFYEYDVTVPKNTPAAAPVRQEVKLTVGKVVAVHVQFPPGCAGLVHLAIDRATHQVWPGNPDASIKADGAIVSWLEDYDLDDVPFGFTLRAWSPGARFPHTVTVRFGLLPFAVVREPSPELTALQRITRFLGIGG